jgi:hypothetical protein
MLQSYAAIYKHGHLEWLDDTPTQENVQVIVTFVQPSQVKQTMPRANWKNLLGSMPNVGKDEDFERALDYGREIAWDS